MEAGRSPAVRVAGTYTREYLGKPQGSISHRLLFTIEWTPLRLTVVVFLLLIGEFALHGPSVEDRFIDS